MPPEPTAGAEHTPEAIGPIDPFEEVDTDGARESRRLVRKPGERPTPLPGFVLPYATDNIWGTFGDCRGRRPHAGLDFGGVGHDFGLGTPVRAAARARVLLIGRPDEDPDRFGQPDVGGGTVERNGYHLPAEREVPGYGLVRFFTRAPGSWNSGAVVVTELLDGDWTGHRIRYMHLGAIHPELQVGDIVEAGQELGVMGGTAVQRDLPHLHLDVETPAGVRIDPAPLFGLPADTRTCARR